jgi:hypothetical protein
MKTILSFPFLLGASLVFVYPIYWISIYGLNSEGIFLLFHSIIFIIFFGIFKNFRKNSFSVKNCYLNKLRILLIFLICLILFLLYGWHNDRESVGASFAAVGRVVWLLTVCICTLKGIYKRTILIITLVLMIFDESRTIFFVCFMAIFYQKYIQFKTIKTIIPLMVSCILMLYVANVRNDIEIISFFDIIEYAVRGEVINSLKPFLSVWSSETVSEIFAIRYFFSYLLLPFYFPIEKIGTLAYLGISDQQDLILEAARISTEVNIAPMGGYHAATDIIIFGYFGLIVWAITLFVWFYVLSFLNLRNGDSYLPLGWLLSPLIIKATPFIFFNLVYYVIVILIIYRILLRKLVF